MRFAPLLLVPLLACAAAAFAQDAAEPRAPRAPPDAIRYRLVVEGPNPPANAIRDGLDLARWQTDEEMTRTCSSCWPAKVAAQAREIAAVEGFYDAKVEVSIDRKAIPYVVTVRVDAGCARRVSSASASTSPGRRPPMRHSARRRSRTTRDGWTPPAGRSLPAGRVDRREGASPSARCDGVPTPQRVSREARHASIPNRRATELNSHDDHFDDYPRIA